MLSCPVKQNFHDFFLTTSFCPQILPCTTPSSRSLGEQSCVSPFYSLCQGLFSLFLELLSASWLWLPCPRLKPPSQNGLDGGRLGAACGSAGSRNQGYPASAEQQCPWLLWLGSGHLPSHPQEGSFVLCCLPPGMGGLEQPVPMSTGCALLLQI